MKQFSGFVFLFLLAWGVSAQQTAQLDGKVGLELKYDEFLSSRQDMGLSAKAPLFDLVARLSVNSDKRYGADIANFRSNKSLLSTYFLIEEGYTVLHLNPVDFQIGRSVQKETFDSPYSLFLNSAGHSANGMVMRYSDPFFFFESRWIELNNRSDFLSTAQTPASWASLGKTGFPDRGANLKTIVLKFGTMRLGIQDSAIYTGRSFDLEYFANPIPEYFTQYFKTTAGRPWTTSGNENNLIGFFWDWKEPSFTLGAQVLIDDFSLHFLLPTHVPNNPWKAAWTVGGQFNTAVGKVGFYHAGALKYTFEPITALPGQEVQSAYGYTLFPSNEYFASGSFRSLSVEDNALGYRHGENNLALMMTWSRDMGRNLTLGSNIEVVLAGSNSPTNPWQDANASNEVGTHWIDEPVLARTFVWTSDLKWTLNDWDFYGSLRLGSQGNLLKLVDPTGVQAGSSALDTLEKIWKPSTTNRGIVSLVLGSTWHWDISRTFWPQAKGGRQP